jgi:hypothetical protein
MILRENIRRNKYRFWFLNKTNEPFFLIAWTMNPN